MRIALVSPYDFPYPGGVTSHILNLSRVFQQRGHEVVVIAPSSGPAAGTPSSTVCVSNTVIPVRTNGSVARINLSPFLAGRVRRLLQQRAFDVLHVHEPVAPALPWTVLRQARAVSPDTAVFGTFHAYMEEEKFGDLCGLFHNVARRHLARVAGCLDGRIAVSTVARDCAASYWPGFYRVIPNGVDVSRFGKMPRLPLSRFQDGINVLYVGRLEPRKGFACLLEAFVRVRNVVPHARLLVVGPYSGQEQVFFERKAQKLGLSGVFFLGYVNDEDLPAYYRAGQVFCAPSLGAESFGMVLLEAMAAGTPIVASDIPGYRCVMQHRVQGLLVPPRDVQALAGALIHLLERPDQRRDMGICGRATAARYAWEKVAGRVLDYYGEVQKTKADESARAVGTVRRVFLS
jgi:phosphatidylinositol alpha-mannosyltransferase